MNDSVQPASKKGRIEEETAEEKATKQRQMKKPIQGMEGAEQIETGNDGECGYTAAGIGNALANVEHSTSDEEKKRKSRQSILGKKEKIGTLTRYKICGYIDSHKDKWKKVKEEEWRIHVTEDKQKEDGPAINTKEEYKEAILQRKKRWIDELMIQWAAYAFNKDIVVLGVTEENTDNTKKEVLHQELVTE